MASHMARESIDISVVLERYFCTLGIVNLCGHMQSCQSLFVNSLHIVLSLSSEAFDDCMLFPLYCVEQHLLAFVITGFKAAALSVEFFNHANIICSGAQMQAL